MGCCKCCCENGTSPGTCCGDTCCRPPNTCCGETECCVLASCKVCTEVSEGAFACVRSCTAEQCCVDGTCTTCPPVTCPETECGAGECCVDGYCVTCPPTGCPDDPCPEGECCVGGACETCTPCSGGDCPEGQCCVDGNCSDCPPEECPGTPCPEGECCVDGYCMPCSPCGPCAEFTGVDYGPVCGTTTGGTDTCDPTSIQVPCDCAGSNPYIAACNASVFQNMGVGAEYNDCQCMLLSSSCSQNAINCVYDEYNQVICYKIQTVTNYRNWVFFYNATTCAWEQLLEGAAQSVLTDCSGFGDCECPETPTCTPPGCGASYEDCCVFP